MSDRAHSNMDQSDPAMMRTLVTGPAASDPGGVSALFGNIATDLSSNKIQIKYLEIGSTRGRFLHPISDQIAFRRQLNTDQFELIQINPSLLQRSFFRDGLFARQAKSRGLPLVVFFHGWSDAFSQKVERHWMHFFAATYGRADAFIVLASDVEEKLVRWGVKAPIFRGTTAIEDSLISGFDLEVKLSNQQVTDEFRLLFLARLEPEKGIYETIDACALLLEKSFPIRLVVAGDGPEAARIQDYARTRLGKNVCFTGYVRGTEKAVLFEEAHAFIMPSYAEGLPISVLEAMAFGLPVVSRPVGGLKDILVDGIHGFTTESKDPAEIAALIEKLIDQPQLMKRISRNVHELAIQEFTASAVAAKLSRLFRDVYRASREQTTVR